MAPSKAIKFSGHAHFRQRLVLATLSGKTIRIENIRSEDNDPGVRDYEASFIRLLEKITNGGIIEISYTGTTVAYKPGVIIGGKITHDCGTSRAIGYFLEAIIPLAAFGKNPLNLTLYGITSDNVDLSADTIRTATLPQLKQFGIEDGVELKITKRGAPPLGGGEIQFLCPNIRATKPIYNVDEGRIKRIRGIAYVTRISPQAANRLVESSRGFLTRYIPDVYVYTDVYRGAESGKSPGFAVSLVAESTTGVLLSAEMAGQAGETPEYIGERTAMRLLEEIKRGGCVDSINQWLVLTMMALGSEDVSKIRVGELTPFSMAHLRDLRDILGVTFKLSPDTSNDTILAACVGIGFTNVNKKTT